MATSTPVCSVCDQQSITKLSTIWCFDCDEGLCLECKHHHSLSKGTKHHGTVTISEYQKIPYDVVKITQFCAKHDEKYIFFCKSHECLCCGSCIVENHMKCRDFDKLADVIQNIKCSNAFYEIEQTLAELADNIKRIRNDRENNLTKLSEQKRQIEQEIYQSRIKINEYLDKIQKEILDKLSASEVKESHLINELLRQLKDKESEISVYQEKIDSVKQHASDLQTFISMKEIEKDVPSKEVFLQSVIESEDCKDRELSFSTNTAMHDLANHIKNFGEVRIETKPCDLVLAKRKDKQAQIILPHISSKSIDAIRLKLLRTIHTRGNATKGCCLLPDGRTAFTDVHEQTVRVFNSDGTQDFEVKTETLAYDIAYISSDNTLAVTPAGSYKQCIIIIDIHNKCIKKTIAVNSNYYGIAVKDGNLICSTCSTAKKGIHLINLQNNQTTDLIRDELPTCFYVATFGEKIYAASSIQQTVKCYDFQGKLQWTFYSPTVFVEPFDISVDNHGNVYAVGIALSSVIVISADGKSHRKILTENDGISIVGCLDYDRSTNRLLVASYEKKAMIFTLT